ncbi:MAG: CHAD domain-containing protein [Bacteroidetes bacterium]|nr:CHAD domain-containing protein [Bacteroidota bacterium]
MLSRKKQRRYLSKKERDWLVQLDAFGRSGDSEAIHKLRLGIKKVRAFVEMMKECSDRKAPKDFALLKKMFRQAGKIRDAENSLRLMERFHLDMGEFRAEQERLRVSATAEFKRKISLYRKKGKKAGRRLQADVLSIRTECVKDWFAARLIKISVLLTGAGDLLHEARKRIKELLYVQRVLPVALAEEIGLNRDYLDRLQEAIGQWHDTAVLLTAYAGKEGVDSGLMFQECKDKEAMVRGLAGDFYKRAHEYA